MPFRIQVGLKAKAHDPTEQPKADLVLEVARFALRDQIKAILIDERIR